MQRVVVHGVSLRYNTLEKCSDWACFRDFSCFWKRPDCCLMERENLFMEIRHIAPFNQHAGRYVGFGNDGFLYQAQAGEAPTVIASLPYISIDGEIKLYVCEPWVCVTERFGTHAALVNLDTAAVRELSREDYYVEVSSYSIGFLIRQGRVLLIHQTDWNRLDIMDVETGRNLTDREVYIREVIPENTDQTNTQPVYEEKNYIDYFHSLLHVSPDGSFFMSNGWLWHPLGRLLCFRTDDFLRQYELSGTYLQYCRVDNWDRPCAFIGNDRLVTVTDAPGEEEEDSPEEDNSPEDDDFKPCEHEKLQFYDLNATAQEREYGEHILLKESEVDCDVFIPDKEGNISGTLVWDSQYSCLVAVTSNGAFAFNLCGEVLAARLECCCNTDRLHTDMHAGPGWCYNPENHSLYHWLQEAGIVEERQFALQSDHPTPCKESV